MAINSPLTIAAQSGKTASAQIPEVVAGGDDGPRLSHADDRI